MADLWVVPTDGTQPPRRLTATRGAESGPAFSPDGKRVAFSARRDTDDVAQIYVIDLGGGEAQRATSVSTGARAPVWRPDGRAILFTSDVYPAARTDEDNRKAADERKKRKWSARVYDSFPIRDWDRWLDNGRPTLMVQALEPGTPATDMLAGSRLAAEPGFAGQWGTGADNISAVWTPDGSGVVFAATTNRTDVAFAEAPQALWLARVQGGEPTRLRPTRIPTAVPRSVLAGPRSMPSSNPIRARLQSAAARAVGLAGPLLAHRCHGDVRSCRRGRYVPSPDGTTVLFLAEDQGHQKLFRVPLAGGLVREVGALTTGTIGALAVAGGATPIVVGTWESAVNPPEVVRIDAASGERSALSRLNIDRAAGIDWKPLERFWFTSSRGRRIHNFMALPPNFDPARKYPLFVLLHGGPHSMWIDQYVLRWNYHLLAQPGYVVLLTNYSGSTGFGEAFAQAIQGDPLEGPGNEVNEAADRAIRRYPTSTPRGRSRAERATAVIWPTGSP